MSVQDEVADTGLMMMGHRFYAPDLGRFLNRDPIGFRGGPNLFEYGFSSPTRFTDATGLEPPARVGDQRYGIDYPREAYIYPEPTLEDGLNAASIYLEPLDFMLTLKDIDDNGLSPWHGLAFLPILSLPIMRALRDAAGDSNIVFRGLRESEDPTRGICATNPSSPMKPTGHVMGGYKNSPYISTTKKRSIARDKYGKHGYIEIDLSKIESEILDLSKGFPEYPKDYMINRRVLKDAEVLIRDAIPADAIVAIFGR